MRRLNDPWIRVALGCSQVPFYFFRLAMEPHIPCACGEMLSLIGFWKCSCGFTYQGHLLRRCPVCFSVPCVVRCYRCGVTTKLLEDA